MTSSMYVQSRYSHCRALSTGSYTFAKTLEYKAKQGLNSGKDVTVIPPIEYQARFVKALDGYFLACPGALNVLMKIITMT